MGCVSGVCVPARDVETVKALVTIVGVILFLQAQPDGRKVGVPFSQTFSPVSGGVWLVGVVQMFADYPRGTAYKAEDVGRTAAHVVIGGMPLSIGVGRGAGHALETSCIHTPTDSATFRSQAPLRNWKVGPAPRPGDRVVALGFIGGVTPTAVFSWVSEVKDRVVAGNATKIEIGPVFFLPYGGDVRGMSGGPVMVGGRVVGTVAVSDGNSIGAVPVSQAACTHS